MKGEVYKIIIHDDENIGWTMRHLLVLEIYKAIKYRGNEDAARCLVLETGRHHEIYVDTLENNGEKVA